MSPTHSQHVTYGPHVAKLYVRAHDKAHDKVHDKAHVALGQQVAQVASSPKASKSPNASKSPKACPPLTKGPKRP